MYRLDEGLYGDDGLATMRWRIITWSLEERGLHVPGGHSAGIFDDAELQI